VCILFVLEGGTGKEEQGTEPAETWTHCNRSFSHHKECEITSTQGTLSKVKWASAAVERGVRGDGRFQFDYLNLLNTQRGINPREFWQSMFISRRDMKYFFW
jgi:hypothetical protein